MPLYAAEQHIWQMKHTSWSNRDGAPRDVVALAQSLDGILWIASNHGLSTFDGFEFKAASSSNDVSGELQKSIWQLVIATDDSVWFAGTTGGVVHLQGGSLTIFRRVQGGDSIRNIGSLQQDKRGNTWCVLNDQKPAFLDSDGSWHPVPLPLVSGEHVQGFLVDSSNTRWLVQQNRLYRQGAGDSKFFPMPLHVAGPATIHEGRNHTIWFAGPVSPKTRSDKASTTLHQVDALGRVLHSVIVPGDVQNFFVDHNGSVWAAAVGEGLRKLEIVSGVLGPSAQQEQVFRKQDGLTSNEESAFFEDGNGNVWVGGGRGIERFAPANLVPALRSQASGMWSTCVDPHGAVLVGGKYDALFRLNGDRKDKIPGVRELNALFCNGRSAWLLDANGIAKITGNGIRHLPLLPGHAGLWDDYIFSSICELKSGTLLAWATGANEEGLWAYGRKGWRLVSSSEHYGRVISIAMDGDRILFGRRDGKVDVLIGEHSTVPVVGNAGIGSVLGFVPTTLGLAAFGREGIALERQGKFVPLRFGNVLVGTRVTGVVQSRNGDLWVNSEAGISRIGLADLRRESEDLNYEIVTSQVTGPGENAPLLFTLSGGSAQRDRNGLLWFGTMDGVIYINPDHTATASSPTLKIVNILGDGQAMGPSLTFKPDTGTLRIQFLGVLLSDPDSVKYRYRLKGYETKWQEVGSRREAVYTNLKPDTYRFEVMASNSLGMWTLPAKETSFRILPHFWQTWWFLVLTLFTCGYAIRLLFQQRLRDARERARMLADERAEERSRIARELHDTLLQGVQGLLLAFEAVRNRLLQGGDVLPLLDSSLSATEALVVEGRERIATIRKDAPLEDALPKRMRALCSSLSDESPTPITLTVTGTSRELRADVSEELYFVARESIRNALKHSGATEVEVTLRYTKRLFRVDVVDNGRGFDLSKELLERGSKASWGLQGMRERAESIHAQLRILSQDGHGTQVIVQVDSKYAYRE